MSFAAEDWAYEQKCGSGVAKSVLVYFAKLASNEGGDCYPSIAMIVQRTEHTERAVRKGIELLVSKGLIERERKYLANGRCTSTLYRLAVVSLATPAETQETPHPEPTPAKTQEPPPWRPSWEGDPCENAGETPAKTQENPITVPKEERTLGLRPNGADVAAPHEDDLPNAPPDDIRTQLWTEGRAILRRTLGMTDSASRNLIGRLLKAAGENCAMTLDVLRGGEREGPHELVPWLMAAIGSRMKPEPAKPKFRNGFTATMYDDYLAAQAAGAPMPVRPAIGGAS